MHSAITAWNMVLNLKRVPNAMHGITDVSIYNEAAQLVELGTTTHHANKGTELYCLIIICPTPKLKPLRFWLNESQLVWTCFIQRHRLSLALSSQSCVNKAQPLPDISIQEKEKQGVSPSFPSPDKSAFSFFSALRNARNNHSDTVHYR